MIDQKTASLAKFLIKRYYSDAKISPIRIERREFGFGDFEKKISYRHFSFKTDRDLRNYLTENSPPFVSYSSAEYQYPDRRPMENKGWMGTWLVFDLDANDMKLECQKQHGSSWVCEICFSSVRDETIRLIEEFLIPDFGISKDEISINFSGNRGYHVTLTSEDIFGLDGKARKEISEYIAAVNIDIKAFFPNVGQRGMKLEGPKPTDGGWGGKFANGVISALNKGEDYLISIGVERGIAKKLSANRANIILGIATSGNWDKINIPKKALFWSNLFNTMAIKQGDSIDKNVTSDIYHLIRVPNTIHGDTGLIAKQISSLAQLTKFEPMNDAIAFNGGEIEIIAKGAPEFHMDGRTFESVDKKKIKMPTCAAMYLLLKEKGNLI